MAGLIGDPAADQRADFGQGLQMAEGFMQNYWRAKEMKVNQERWMANQAIRDAQLEEQRLQNAAMVNAAAKQQRQAKAMAGLLQLDTMVAAEGYDQSGRKFVVDYAAKNPDIADTPVYQNILKSFDKAEATQVRQEMQQEDLNNKLEIAALKGQLSNRNLPPGDITVRPIGDTNKMAYWTGESWREVDDKAVEGELTPIINKTTGKEIPGLFTDSKGRLIKSSPPSGIASVFESAGGVAPGSVPPPSKQPDFIYKDGKMVPVAKPK